jgi:hypothetical protein
MWKHEALASAPNEGAEVAPLGISGVSNSRPVRLTSSHDKRSTSLLAIRVTRTYDEVRKEPHRFFLHNPGPSFWRSKPLCQHTKELATTLQ